LLPGLWRGLEGRKSVKEAAGTGNNPSGGVILRIINGNKVQSSARV
jgi:hypothetical protein